MGGKILVADDSPNIRDILKMSLETAGYEVLLAEDGEQAVEIFDRDKPDLLIVDVMMPKANGFQICRRVKTNVATSTIPVILLTAKSQQEDIFWGKDCGADEYITKPFSTKELERTIARLLKPRHAEADHGSGVAEEHRVRREKGEECQVVSLEWGTRAMDIFRKKYGEFKHNDLLQALRREALQFLQDQKDPGPVDLHDSTGLTLVLRGTAAQALKGARALAGRLNGAAAMFYDAEDRGRGYIPFRSPLQKKEERLPLLSFTPRIGADLAA